MSEFYTTEEAAAYCGLTVAAFKKRIRDGRIVPAVRKTRVLLFTKEAIDALKAQPPRPNGRPRRLTPAPAPSE